jgi:uncharacterized protein with HEPN domain
MKDERIYLNHILKNIAQVQRLAQTGKKTFFKDEDQQAAILYYLQTMAESTSRVSQATQAKQPQIAWNKIRGFRNIVAHDYLSVDLDLVWSTIEHELTPLKSAIEALLIED